MKLKQFVYLTTVFSLSISTVFAILSPQKSLATTKYEKNTLKFHDNYINFNQENLKQTIQNHQLSETPQISNLLPNKPNKPIQIAQQAYQGRASWYGPKFHGRRTANGEIFNSNALTAAHPSLPFGTKLRVTNLRNGNSVVVRVNDRGPFVKGRIIDVSAGAARILNMIHSGVANVQIEVLGR